MRLIGAATLLFLVSVGLAVSGGAQAPQSVRGGATPRDDRREGQTIFRFDTFGDEQLWTDVLRMHDVIENVSPATALAVGLKVDVDALPPEVITALSNHRVDLNDPQVTRLLLSLNAVVGVKGVVSDSGHLQTVGVTCALCHSTVDNSFAPGIGHRLDGWQNSDLDPGTILSLSNFFDETTKAELRGWGKGRYDPRHHYFNGMNIVPLNSSLPVVIPPIYGLKKIGFETVTADGPIGYWNAYVGIGQMGGKGTFNDPRVNVFINQTPDLVTPKLPALVDYEMSLDPPDVPRDAFDRQAAQRGKDLFRGAARCDTCHQNPDFTDVLSSRDRSTPFLHAPAETGMDPRYAMRSATGRYRTTPLRALLRHAPYFHDGSAPDLRAVVEHYDQWFGLNLTAAQKADVVEYLKSL